MRRVLLSNLAARVVVTPVSALASLVGAWLAIDYLGATPYAAVLLITGLAQLLPFVDFGVGAAVINAIGGAEVDGISRQRLFTTLVSAQRILVLGGIGLLAFGGALAVAHAWPSILGAGADALTEDPNIGVVSFLCALATFVFLQLGYRMLTGAGKNQLGTMLGGAASLLTLGFLAIGAWMRLSVLWFVIAPTVAAALLALAACILGSRAVGLAFSTILRALPRLKEFPSVSLRSTALPMMVILVALPVLVFSDRIILSHVGPRAALAEYSVASQVYAPAWGAVTGTLIALWPLFTQARSGDDGAGRTGIARAMRLVIPAALLLSTCFAFLLPLATRIVGHGEASASWSLSIGFGALLLIQAAFYPLGVYLTRAKELQFQAWCVLLMLIVGLPASVAAARAWGAPGPVFVSAFAILLFQFIPALVYMRLERKVREDA